MENKYFCKSFENLASFHAYLNGTPYSKTFAGRSHDSVTGTRAFTGTDSYEAAEKLLIEGDAESAAKIYKAVNIKIKQTAGAGTKMRRFSSVCGGAVNVPATLVGLPKSMYNTKKIHFENGSKVLTICYNNNASSCVSVDEKVNASAALVAAVVELENRGYRINLYASCSAYNGHEYCANFVKVKDSGQYMDLLKMSYPLVNPSFQRRHAFRFRETMPGLSRGWVGGYGCSVTDSATVATLAKEAGLNLKKIVTYYEIDGKTPAEIVDKILS